ncbi:TetR family transcriptional regulator [[Phormidium ambiguum] IAM M-71]|uniref:TetR family transcriptional regulator n=1 Tax=[Phormidium ambiguum] IAM M-71 TaxID=454136 RepID=A0A1U7IMH3_9CYAN|nr:TetR/AcrR family transcriptional regulator [Phormidium ambiguum]OKH38441.1 TetR family transcriptional regulator [Phormidium ambiguum IAM M-71]
MGILQRSPQPQSEDATRNRIIKAAQKLFARQGYDGTTTRDLAMAAGVAEGTVFRHFPNKKAILIEVATQGWVEILTDLLTELSEMESYEAVGKVMRRRMLNFHKNGDLMRVCFMEAQFHEDLRDRVQTEVIDKMTNVAEAFFETAMERGIYRKMNPRIVAQVFVGMFAIAGFSHNTIMEPQASPQEMKEMAEGIADIFLNGVLAKG